MHKHIPQGEDGEKGMGWMTVPDLVSSSSSSRIRPRISRDLLNYLLSPLRSECSEQGELKWGRWYNFWGSLGDKAKFRVWGDFWEKKNKTSAYGIQENLRVDAKEKKVLSSPVRSIRPRAHSQHLHSTSPLRDDTVWLLLPTRLALLSA